MRCLFFCFRENVGFRTFARGVNFFFHSIKVLWLVLVARVVMMRAIFVTFGNSLCLRFPKMG